MAERLFPSLPRSIENDATNVVNKTNEFYASYLEKVRFLISKKGIEARDAFFRNQTVQLKRELQSLIDGGMSEQDALSSIMPKAYGLVKAASHVLFNKPHHDAQIYGGYFINAGTVSQMATGEGKTLTAALPAYLNALTGKGVHVVTPNDYLAKRDHDEMGELYGLLGLSCGLAERRAGTDAIERGKRAYEADITYGSSEALAFDYLFDDREKDPNKMVNRAGRPYFAIVDEVDSVLFDSARTPFRLSGVEKDSHLKISDQEKARLDMEIVRASTAVSQLSPIETLSDQDFEAYTKYAPLDAELEAAMVINEKTKDYRLTRLGEVILFYQYYQKEIDSIRSEYNLSISSYQDLASLINAERIGPLTDLFYDEFYREVLYPNHDLIDNSMKAWFILERDKDYVLSPTKEGLSVQPVNDGRTKSDRKYALGLQQAVEQKERIINPNSPIATSKLLDTLASIPTTSFYARYEKLSGMTGTSATSAFKELYGLETTVIPRAREYRVNDRGNVFTATSDQKYIMIFEEVLASYKKGQPVLISTTSIGESEKLAQFLNMMFERNNIKPPINVLNANVNELKKEADIIAKAGLPGAITISTEMAGRGTDIKLGGESPTYDDALAIIILEIMQKQEQMLGRRMSLEERRRQIGIIKNKPEVKPIVEQRLKQMKQKHGTLVKKVQDAGGLKVIGSGHFKSSRIDNQIRGRCGRQGDPGEIIFFSDPMDLVLAGLKEDRVEAIRKQTKNGPIIEKKDGPLAQEIERTQNIYDGLLTQTIKYEQTIERVSADCRAVLHLRKEEVNRNDKSIECLMDYIDIFAERIIQTSSPHKAYLVDRTTTLKKAKVNPDRVISMAENFLGVKLDASSLSKNQTVEELINIIKAGAFDILSRAIDAKGEELVRGKIKDGLNRVFSRSWALYEELIEQLKTQDRYNKMNPQQSSIDPELEMSNAAQATYEYAIETEMAHYMRQLFNPKGKIDRLRYITYGPNGVEEITEEEYLAETPKEEFYHDTYTEGSSEMTAIQTDTDLYIVSMSLEDALKRLNANITPDIFGSAIISIAHNNSEVYTLTKYVEQIDCHIVQVGDQYRVVPDDVTSVDDLMFYVASDGKQYSSRENYMVENRFEAPKM